MFVYTGIRYAHAKAVEVKVLYLSYSRITHCSANTVYCNHASNSWTAYKKNSIISCLVRHVKRISTAEKFWNVQKNDASGFHLVSKAGVVQAAMSIW